MECLCRHFYSPVYHRDMLTRMEHINLLATPKGYRWYGPGGEDAIKSRAYRGKSMKKKESQIEVPAEVFPGMGQFMNDVWLTLTPEMLLCLKEILETEFNMTPKAAILFLMKQYLKTQRAADRERNDPCLPTEEQVDWARNIASSLASKVIQYTEMMTDAKRTKRTSMLNKAILERLQKATGLQPQGDTTLNKVVQKVADGLAVWLSSLPGENNYQNICSDLMTVYFDVPLQ